MRNIVTDTAERFCRDTNRVHFRFSHGLADAPEFRLSNLALLARRVAGLAPHTWANGATPVSDRWSDGTIGRQSLPDTITNIEHNDSIVMLRRVEQDEEFAPLLQDLLLELLEHGGNGLRADVLAGEVCVLLSSPGRIIPYRMDAELNFRLQIAGHSTVRVFDPTDRTLVTPWDLERFHALGPQSVPCRADNLDAAACYAMRGGDGVHMPALAPYWTHSEGGVSIAIHIRYSLRTVALAARVHRFNHRLRRLGLKPVPPGHSAWRDRLKLSAFRGLRALSAPRRPSLQRPLWRPPRPSD